MSLTNDDRKIQSESGKKFPSDRFAVEIASALRRQYGGERGGLKAVVELTGANQRTVANWFDAKNGPSGESLITLCRHSEEVLDTILLMAGRTIHARAFKLALAKERVRELLAVFDGLDES